MEDVDQYGDKSQRLYLVRKTKSTKNLAEMRPSESQKLKCGSRHFDGLGVDYRLVVSANELPGGSVVK
jgi:type III restriction enzyme